MKYNQNINDNKIIIPDKFKKFIKEFKENASEEEIKDVIDIIDLFHINRSPKKDENIE